MNKDIL